MGLAASLPGMLADGLPDRKGNAMKQPLTDGRLVAMASHGINEAPAIELRLPPLSPSRLCGIGLPDFRV